MSETGTIVLRRERKYRDKLRAYKIFVDGEQVGSIRDGGEVSLEVPVGPHEVQLKIDWKGSPELAVDVKPGEAVVLICRGGRTGRAALDLFSKTGSWVELFEAGQT